MKLLVNAQGGAQELIEVGEGGGYFDPARVLWDERTDGPLPQITLGGMVREGGSLVFDQATFDATAAVNRGAVRAALAARIDAAVIAIYDKPVLLSKEYEQREAQAQAYKDAGYVGDVPPRVAGFAMPAGLTAQAATDLILQQAAQLRGALDSLSDLRMQKYVVTKRDALTGEYVATDAEAQASADFTLSQIAAIAADLA